jgi:hypothetical protein
MTSTTRIPKPYQRKNGKGKAYGSFYVKIDNQEVNLATSDTTEAWRRSKAAKVDGKRNFKEDALAAAAAAVDSRIGAPPPTDPAAAATAAAVASTTAPPQPPAASPAPPSAAPAAAAATSGAGSPGTPAPEPSPAHQPLSNQSTTPPHEAAADAAREATQDRDSTPPPPPGAAQFTMSPEFLAMIAKQAAKVAVDLQLVLQAWIVFKRTGDRPGKVTPDMIATPLLIWEAQFTEWARVWALDAIPPWAIAIVLTGMVGFVQYGGRQPQPPKGHFGQSEPIDIPFTEASHQNGQQRKAA